MPHVSTTASILKHARRGALLLALGAAGPAAWGQSFGPVSTYPTGAGSRPTDVALGDLNNDGRLDIATALSGTSAVGELLNQSPNGFAAVSSYASSAAPYGVALGDLNGDGRLDMVTSNYFTSSVDVRLGQLGGGFASVTSYSTGAGSTPNKELALADLNADGRLDIITVNVGTNTIGVLLWQTNGFAPVSNYTLLTGTQPQDVAVGDISGDGILEIVVADGTGSVRIMNSQPSGFGTHTLSLPLNPGSTTSNLTLGDVNGDGKLDIITANSTGTIGLFLSAPNSVIYSSYSAGTNTFPTSLALGDVNGDGQPDIIVGYDNTGSVGILLSQSAGTFGPVTNYPVSNGPIRLALGDVNGDRRPDIVTASFSTNAVGVLLNTGTYTPLATARPTAADLTLAPNPAHDGFAVTLPAGLAPTQAELLNSLGQVVRRPATGAATGFRVETAGLAPGLYTLRVRARSAALARRVVVE